MRKRALVTAMLLFPFCFGVGTVSQAKDVTVKGAVGAFAEDGKSMTLKVDGGGELTCGVSSKRTKLMKGAGPASRKELTPGKGVTVVYDDENPANEAKVITLAD